VVALVATSQAHETGWGALAALALASSLTRSEGAGPLLVDLALADPRMHMAAALPLGEGLSEWAVFGAELSRVAKTTPSGVRLVSAGTPAPDDDEVLSAQPWREVEASLILTYVCGVPPEGLLEAADHLVLLRGREEDPAVLEVGPSVCCVLVPPPATQPTRPSQATEAPHPGGTDVLTDEILDDEAFLADSDAGGAPDPATRAPNGPATTGAVQEGPRPDVDPVDDVGGLEAEPEWPAFAQPMVVHAPGDVDPDNVSQSPPPPDSGTGSLTDDFMDLDIGVSDDLAAESPPVSQMGGSVDPTVETREPAGEGRASRSADDIWGAEFRDELEGDLAERTLDLDEASPTLANSHASPDSSDPEPPEPAPPEPVPHSEVEPLPWEKVQGPEPAPLEEAAFDPVATVTRTRQRSAGLRPRLLIATVLLLVVLAILSWTGLLDVPGLGFLNGDSP